jgi:hypothetical protein
MRSWRRAALAAGVAALVLAVLAPSGAHGQDKTKEVSFKTADGVTLQGTLYPAGGKKVKEGNPVVMLLHDFSAKDGGGSSQGKMGDLAAKLQDAGFAVLAFDFRGFGNSKDVSKEIFWDTRKNPHNNVRNIKFNLKQPPETIDYKNFYPHYYAYLVYDVAAAKAFLDRANDRKELNSSNLLIIGAGQGATVGAMWVANECYRRRDKNPQGKGFAVDLGEPEVNDVAGCIWLTLSTKIEGRAVGGTLKSPWLRDAAKTHKVPMAFYYGSKHAKDDEYFPALVKGIKGDSDLKLKAISVDSSSAGGKLLDEGVITKIVTQAGNVMDGRSKREMLNKKVESSAYYYQPVPKGRATLNKKAGDEAPPVDITVLGLPR